MVSWLNVRAFPSCNDTVVCFLLHLGKGVVYKLALDNYQKASVGKWLQSLHVHAIT